VGEIEIFSFTLTWAVADCLESAVLVAVMLTDAGFGTSVGAVYSPLVEIVPTVTLPVDTPFTLHVTAVLEVPVTVGVNCCVPPTATVAVRGEMETVIVEVGGGAELPPPPQEQASEQKSAVAAIFQAGDIVRGLTYRRS